MSRQISTRSNVHFWPEFISRHAVGVLCFAALSLVASSCTNGGNGTSSTAQSHNKATGSATASEIFGFSNQLASVTTNGKWIAAGLLCPANNAIQSPQGLLCEPDLVLGGAVMKEGQWRTKLLVRFSTALLPSPDPCQTETTSALVPNESVIVVGCFNGGSDGESFVIVLGFEPNSGLPQILLDEDCRDTGWLLKSNALVIQSWDLRAGASQPSQRHPDVSFTWSGGPVDGFMPNPTTYGANGSDFPAFCQQVNSVGV